MPKGKGHRFTSKQHREAMHVAASERRKGKSNKQALRIGWATVNKRKKKRR
jgi:hypothetical protein